MWMRLSLLPISLLPTLYHQWVYQWPAIPFGIYGFLPAKSRADYNRFFTIVKEEMQNLGLIFQPTAIMSDFELALLQALELQFPNTRTLGCLFHFSQCL